MKKIAEERYGDIRLRQLGQRHLLGPLIHKSFQGKGDHNDQNQYGRHMKFIIVKNVLDFFDRRMFRGRLLAERIGRRFPRGFDDARIGLVDRRQVHRGKIAVVRIGGAQPADASFFQKQFVPLLHFFPAGAFRKSQRFVSFFQIVRHVLPTSPLQYYMKPGLKGKT